MALNTRNGVDPRWVAHNIRAELALSFATIEIYNPQSATDLYNPTTNSWTNQTTVLWTGKARVQGRTSASTASDARGGMAVGNPSFGTSVEFTIGLRENQLNGSNGVMPDLRPGHKVKVTASPFDGALINFDYTIRSVLNSSNPWSRNIVCEVNQELNPNNV